MEASDTNKRGRKRIHDQQDNQSALESSDSQADSQTVIHTKKIKLSKQAAKTKTVFKSSPIGIVPTGGYTRQDTFSKKSIMWLHLITRRTGLKIQHALNGGEYQIPGTAYRCDGFSEATQTIFEFYGCIFHACPICFGGDKQCSWRLEGISFAQRYAMTINRKVELQSLGYKIVEIWEHEADVLLSNLLKDEKQYLETVEIVERLEIRDSFFGGRTNAIRLYAEADENTVIRYYDVTSLYPYVNKNARYPVGHPVIITDNFQDMSQYFGIAKVKILPPRNLYLPVLPYKDGGKLKFPLCRTCCINETLLPCHCSDAERCLTGTYVTEELMKAVSKGYKIIKIYEVYHYPESAMYDQEKKTGGLFTDFVNTFLKVKTEASGYPAE